MPVENYADEFFCQEFLVNLWVCLASSPSFIPTHHQLKISWKLSFSLHLNVQDIQPQIWLNNYNIYYQLSVIYSDLVPCALVDTLDLDKLWLAQKSNKRSLLQFNLKRPFLLNMSLQVILLLPMWALKSKKTGYPVFWTAVLLHKNKLRACALIWRCREATSSSLGKL